MTTRPTPSRPVSRTELLAQLQEPKTIQAIAAQLGACPRRMADRLTRMEPAIFDRGLKAWRLRTPSDPPKPRRSTPSPAPAAVEPTHPPAPPLRVVVEAALRHGPRALSALAHELGMASRWLGKRLWEMDEVIFDKGLRAWRLRTKSDPAHAKPAPRRALPDAGFKASVMGWLAIHKAATARTIQEQPWGKRPHGTMGATLRELVSEGKLAQLRKGLTYIYHLPTSEGEREAGRVASKVRGRSTRQEMEEGRLRVLALAQRDGAVTSVGVQAELVMLPSKAYARLRELEADGRLVTARRNAPNARQVFALPGAVVDLRAVAVSLARQTGGVSAREVAAHMGLTPAQVARAAQEEAQAWGVEVAKVGPRVVLRAERPTRA